MPGGPPVNTLDLKATLERRKAEMVTAYGEFENATTPTEQRAKRNRFDVADAGYKTAKAELDLLEAEASGGSEIRVKREPHTYEKHGQHSFLGDLYQARISGSRQAEERLQRHQQEMDVDGRGEGRALSSTDSEGGYLVAPLYLQNEFVTLARAGRPTANAVRGLSLPAHTDSINIPRMATGTATEGQKDNAEVKETAATFGLLNAPVRTISGQQDFSRQLFDRSLPAIESVVLGDLAADYATKVDVGVLSGDGEAPNVKGIFSVEGINEVTYTDAEPSVPKLIPRWPTESSRSTPAVTCRLRRSSCIRVGGPGFSRHWIPPTARSLSRHRTRRGMRWPWSKRSARKVSWVSFRVCP